MQPALKCFSPVGLTHLTSASHFINYDIKYSMGQDDEGREAEDGA